MPVEELFVTVQQLDNKYNLRGRHTVLYCLTLEIWRNVATGRYKYIWMRRGVVLGY